MARTRGVAVAPAKLGPAYADGGELLGKNGEPMSPVPTRSAGVPALHPHAQPSANPVAVPPAAEPAARPAMEFTCDMTTVKRGIDAHTALKLIDAFLRARTGEGFSFVLPEAEGAAIGPDARVHMARRPAAA